MVATRKGWCQHRHFQRVRRIKIRNKCLIYSFARSSKGHKSAKVGITFWTIRGLSCNLIPRPSTVSRGWRLRKMVSVSNSLARRKLTWPVKGVSILWTMLKRWIKQLVSMSLRLSQTAFKKSSHSVEIRCPWPSTSWNRTPLLSRTPIDRSTCSKGLACRLKFKLYRRS